MKPIQKMEKEKGFVSLKVASASVIAQHRVIATAKTSQSSALHRQESSADVSGTDRHPILSSRGLCLHNDVGLGRLGMAQVSENVVTLFRRGLQNLSAIRSLATLRHVRDVSQVHTCPDGE